MRSLKNYDITIVYGELFPYLPSCLERQLLTIPYIYDFDDSFFLKYRTRGHRWLSPLLGNKFDRLIEGAVAVTAGNAELASYASNLNKNVTLLPSVVDTDRMSPASVEPTHDQGKPFTVGWIGSPSTTQYLSLLVQPLQELARERPVRLIVVGGAAPDIPGVEVTEHSWFLEREVSLIQQFDVGVMPLPDNSWTRGKSAYKLIQCMSCAIPVIASPVGANVDVVPPQCGLLARSPEQWLRAFRQLASDTELRHQLGASARQWVQERYSLQAAAPILASVIRRSAPVASASDASNP